MYKAYLKLTCVVLLAVFFIPCVSARGGVFVIGPMHEAIETVELKVSNSMHAEVCGNISAINGFADFYVTSPSGNIILCYNKTSFSWFNFSAIENGTYTMHLANTETENEVTATLNYGVNFEVILQTTISPTWHTDVTWQTTIITPSPSWDILKTIFGILSAFNLLATLGKGLMKFFRLLRWIKKYKKSKTPVVFKRIDHILH